MENKKERRKDIRIPLIFETVTLDSIPVDGAKVITETCEVADISKGGAFIKTIANLKPKSFINIRFRLPGDLGLFQVRAQILWKRWGVPKGSKDLKLGIAVKFVDVSAMNAKILDAYLIYLRNQQIITVSKRIIEEFFGDKPVE